MSDCHQDDSHHQSKVGDQSVVMIVVMIFVCYSQFGLDWAFFNRLRGAKVGNKPKITNFFAKKNTK
jgi:hypothetical protein